MKRSIYSVYDLKAKTYCNPFVMENDDCAIREFATAANDLTTNIGKYPSDYCLYSVGQFDYDTGTLSPSLPTSLGLGASFVKTEVIENGL